MNQQSHFQLVLCPVRAPDTKYLDLYNKIYKCWHKVWKEAYEEINYGDKNHFHSDSFTRQDFAVALFYKNECAGLLLFRYVDLSLESTLQDSYFEQWNEIHRKALANSGGKILICSYLSVDPLFRKNALGISLKDLIVGLIAEVTMHANVDATISTPRKNRNVHNMTSKWGAQPIAQDINWGNGILVDLVAFFKKNIIFNNNPDMQPLINMLWQQKIIINEDSIPQLNDFKLSERYGTQIQMKDMIG